MCGQTPWENGRRAWERIGGWHRADHRVEITPDTQQHWGDTSMRALEDIRLIRGLLNQVELGAVRTARRCGKSWAEIGTMLGVTRQTAWERWHDDDEVAPLS